MFTKLGIFSLAAGFVMGIFSTVSGFMESKNFWVDLTLSKIIGNDTSETVITLIGSDFIQKNLDFLIYDLPFFCFLFGLGVVFLIISLFVKDH
ncbi:hypothetical protein [Desulfobacula toluolica]|uniref:hypothetical protein n=1 Tax=Desulfobacula toluolica TaxID=28223 RepID=UPI0011D265D5|nr:hypothetical protein [Desulfobacula toluolica]